VTERTEYAVEARAIAKFYGPTAALDGAELTVAAGTVHGLVGPNGAGKTTLLAALLGLVLPDEGTLRLFGRTRDEAGADWLGGVAGFVETPRFYPYLSARKNLRVLQGLDGITEPAQIDQALNSVGLTRAGDQKVRGYSLGMRQRLGLAAALLRQPRLLILDEPANGMDPAGIRDLRRELRALAGNAGVTVLVSSHDIAQVEEICDAVTVLNHGRTVYAGNLDAMRSSAPDPVWHLLTSDDTAAEALTGDEIKVEPHRDGGLTVRASQEQLDAYTLRLAADKIAVRGLTLDMTPLESLFFTLTETP
jgi:ABC-2 type transport system ATP-binding protein